MWRHFVVQNLLSNGKLFFENSALVFVEVAVFRTFEGFVLVFVEVSPNGTFFLSAAESHRQWSQSSFYRKVPFSPSQIPCPVCLRDHKRLHLTYVHLSSTKLSH